MQGLNGGQGKEEESRYLASYSRQMPKPFSFADSARKMKKASLIQAQA
jgi:hypothetical protein